MAKLPRDAKTSLALPPAALAVSARLTGLCRRGGGLVLPASLPARRGQYTQYFPQCRECFLQCLYSVGRG